MSNKQGWVSLYRSIMDHWLYPYNRGLRYSEYEAWQELLMLVAHKDFKHMLQGKLVEIPRGCYITSQVQLAKRWKWNRRTVAKFLKLLEKENMITLTKIDHENIKSCTRLRINNYGLYQDNLTHRCTTNYTSEYTTPYTSKCTQNNNDNNYNNENKKEFKNFKKSSNQSYPSFVQKPPNYQKFEKETVERGSPLDYTKEQAIDYYNELPDFAKNTKMNMQLKEKYNL